MRLRVDQKLFLSYLAVIAAVVLALTLGVGSMLRTRLTENAAADLRRELSLARALGERYPGLSPDSLADLLGSLSERRVTLIGRDGTVRGDSELDGPELAAMENHGSRPEVRAAIEGRWGQAVRRSASVGTAHLYLTAPTRDGTVIRLSFPLDEVQRAVGRVQRGIFGVGVVALALTGLLSFGFSLAVTHPLRQLAAVARAMAAGDLGRRAVGRVRPRDEVGELADALDSLAGELQRRLGQLEGERAEMQALIDAMAEGVIAVDASGRVKRANPAARRIFSLARDPRGFSPQEVARRRAYLDFVQRALAGEPVPPTELRVDGQHLLGTAQPLAAGAVMVFLDVSALRRLEDVRRDFVANASHELKTPLTAIRGFSETLLDPDLPAPLRRQFAETVKQNADRLQRIVDDLLDLSRLESGGWRVQPEIVSVCDMAREAWSAFADAAGRKGVRFGMEVAPEAEYVLADPSGLRQVLTNLFGNALRYTPPEGEITVRARCVAAPSRPGAEASGGAGEGEARPWVEVAVADTGSGIPSAHLPRIFERFYRVDAARSREEGGTGLGLAIVKHLVEGHGGAVEAESQLGRGTTIRFTLPLPDAHDEGDGHGEAPDALEAETGRS